MLFFKFFTAYLLSGYVLKLELEKSWPKEIPNYAKVIFAYSVSPLIISLILFLLYSLFPGHGHIFYDLFIYIIVFSALLASGKEIINDFFNFPTTLKNVCRSIKNSVCSLSLIYKVFLIFVFFLLLFIAIRCLAYPPTWTDAISYLRQGQVFGLDRALDRMQSRLPFHVPGGDYIMDTAIRPAIPLFFSFFYGSSNAIVIGATNFLYFYYFILTILLLIFLLWRCTRSSNKIILGLTLLFSSFYFIHYNLIGFKEIILIFLNLLGIYLVSQLRYFQSKKDLFKVFGALGLISGLMIFVNFSGLILSFLLLLSVLLSWKYPIKQKLSLLAFTVILAFIFSGNEFIYDFKFFFNPNLLSSENQLDTYQSTEVSAYKITDSNRVQTDSRKTDILIKGKLQGLTQPYLFSVIFYLFAILSLANLFLKKNDYILTKILSFFIVGWFFLIMDPFFLNPHKSAYVLGINPKYTVMIIPAAILVCTIYWGYIDNLFKKLNLKWFYTVSVFLLGFIPPIRDFLTDKLFNLITSSLPIINEKQYYISKINLGIFVCSTIALFFLLVVYMVNKKNDAKIKLEMLNFFFVLVLFVFPFAFEFTSNYKIIPIFKYAFSPDMTKKLIETSPTPIDKDLFDIVASVNDLNNSETVNTLLQDGFGSYYSNISITVKRNTINQIEEKDLTPNIEGLLLVQNSMLDSGPSEMDRSMIIKKNQSFTLFRIK